MPRRVTTRSRNATPVAHAYGAFLKERRAAKGLSLRQLASKVDKSFTYLSKVENAKLAPPAEETVRDIARALGEDPEIHVQRARKLSVRDVITAGSAFPDEALPLLQRLTRSPLPAHHYVSLLRQLDQLDATPATTRRRRPRTSA